MPLTTVTITGANSINQAELVDIWTEYPFVEWGILIGSNTGPRFPAHQWIRDLVAAREATENRMRLSLHVCGKYLRDIANGGTLLMDDLGPALPAFQRVQLNWHGEHEPQSTGEKVLSAFCKMDVFGWDPTIIFQFDGVNDSLFMPASRRFQCAGLFDRSHGAGVLPSEWPQAHLEIQSGWAGGLGADNLAEELPKIDLKAWNGVDYWVDMESKVRLKNDADISVVKVAKCLEIAKAFINAQDV